jgi:uncharacterized membrane protein
MTSSEPTSPPAQPRGNLQASPAAERRGKNRLEAFSDGVFAVAITLLVLEIKIPNTGHLWQSLLDLWPTYIAYLLSFGTVLIMWVNHHVLLDYIGHVDHAFLYLNGLLLMTITVVPVMTGLLAQYAGGVDGHVAAAVYCVYLAVVALAFNAVWWYAASRGRLLRDRGHSGQSAVSRRYIVGPALYLVAFATAFFSVALSLVICGCLALFFAWPYHPKAR